MGTIMNADLRISEAGENSKAKRVRAAPVDSDQPPLHELGASLHEWKKYLHAADSRVGSSYIESAKGSFFERLTNER